MPGLGGFSLRTPSTNSLCTFAHKALPCALFHQRLPITEWLADALLPFIEVMNKLSGLGQVSSSRKWLQDRTRVL